MSRDEESWTLERLGVVKPIYVLQKHLQIVKVGRAQEVQLQCLALHVSRQHCEFRRKICDGKIYWNIIDVGSAAKTYVNGAPIAHHEEIGLNDRDIISIGTKLTASTVKNDSMQFAYLVRAPAVWNANENASANELDETIREDATTPPPTTEPVLAIKGEPQSQIASGPVYAGKIKVEKFDESRIKSPTEPKPKVSIQKHSTSKANPGTSGTSKNSNHQMVEFSSKSHKSRSSSAGQRVAPTLAKCSRDSVSPQRNKRSSSSPENSPVVKKSRKKPRVIKSDSEDDDDDDNSNRNSKLRRTSSRESFRKEVRSADLNRKQIITKPIKIALDRLAIPDLKLCLGAKVSKNGKICEWIYRSFDNDSDDSFSLLQEEDRSPKRKRSNPPSIDYDQCPDVNPLEDVSVIENDAANFSQMEEVIELNSDSEEEYLSQHLHVDKLQVQVKEERQNDDEDEEINFDLNFDRENPDDEVVILNEEDLDNTQMALFEKVISRIKKEKVELEISSSQSRSPPPPPFVEPEIEDDDDDDESSDGMYELPRSVSASPKSKNETSDDDNAFPGEESDEGSERQIPMEEESDEELVIDDTRSPETEPNANQIRAAIETDQNEIAQVESAHSGSVEKEGSAPVEENLPRSVFDDDSTASRFPESYVGPSSTSGELSEEFPRVSDTDESLSFRSEPKCAKLISPLPQPHRRSYLRGISSETAERIFKQNQEMKKSGSNDWISKKPVSTADIRADRQRKLQEIAAKNQQQQTVKQIPSNSVSRPSATAKVKTSDPKIAKLTEFNLFEELKPSKKSTTTSAAAATSELRRVAETIPVDNGRHRVIKKMTFRNVITNVGSQNLTNVQPPPPEKLKPLMYSTIAATDPTAKKKKLRWRDQASNLPLCNYREIPLESKGLKVRAGVKDWSGLDIPNKDPSTVDHHRRSIEKKRSYEDILFRVLKWLPSWLSEQERCNEEPKVEGECWKVNHVPSIFANESDYTKTFYPLMLHDLWATVFKDYLENKKNQQQIISCITRATIPENGTLGELHLYSLISDQECRHDVGPSDGWLVTLNLRYTSTESAKGVQIKPCLGLVTYCNIFPRPPHEAPYDSILLKSTPPHRSRKLNKAMTMTVTVKKLSGQFDYSKPFVVTAISRIKASLRLFKAISNAEDSILFTSILKPTLRIFAVDSGIETMPQLKTSQPLNSEQMRIVSSCSRACTTDLLLPRIMLIQGPPGTGKSTTIASTVLQIFNRWRMNNPGTNCPRILITAPSNAAVDELVLKLISLNAELEPKRRFNMMRVGIEHSVHPSVKAILFERLLENEMSKVSIISSNNASVRLEIEDRKSKLRKLGEELEKETEDDKRQLLHRKIKKETEFLDRAIQSAATTQKLPDREIFRLRKVTTERLFAFADIIATTLSSSMNAYMERFFVSNTCGVKNLRPFSICIVDEASQCVEPEMLIPFSLGFSKLIMVGDPEQLPATVSSPLAKEMSYGESMFKRLFKFFEGSKSIDSTTLRLRVQYRMHPEIINWPNSYFYGGALSNGPQNREFPLLNYLLFDMPRSVEQVSSCAGSSICNEDEAEFVASLAKALRDRMTHRELQRTIGVITFYSKQRRLIAQKIEERGIRVSNDRRANLANGIEVQTVDGFQGSECDIIIISCTRGLSYNRRSIGFVADEQRLNVALTRAKYALYVVGNFKVLRVNSMWNALYSNASSRKRIKEVPHNFRDAINLLAKT